MKIDRSKLRKTISAVPAECKALIDKIKACSDSESLLEELRLVKTWTYGKCELYHWSDVLDVCDEVLEQACKKTDKDDNTSDKEEKWTLFCDTPAGSGKQKELLLQVLQFTALLIEHSFTRHLYNSMEHLTTLLTSSDMTVVLGVLNLLYVFSKRSNYITRLNTEKKQGLIVRLTHLAESWGGKENGFGLAECCQDLPRSAYPNSSTTLHFEYYAEQKGEKKAGPTALLAVHIDGVDQIPKLSSEIMEDIVKEHDIANNRRVLLFTHIRLAHSFSRYERRVQCVQARLQAISILVYSNAIQENLNSLLYSGFIEELVDILEIKDPKLLEIKAAALRTLTSIIHLERNPKLKNIIDVTGAASYHGFLPVLVRTCIQNMTDPELEAFPQPFATALFSFLYHLASYEGGGEALVSCGMMESLLRVINWYGDGQEHITFVTRAVRVVDLITNLDMAAFQTHGGLSAFINRLEHEVDICRKEQPFVIKPKRSESTISIDSNVVSPSSNVDMAGGVAMETDGAVDLAEPSTSTAGEASTSVFTGATRPDQKGEQKPRTDEKTAQCFPQRAALLKSMLNFLKKAVPDPAFSDSIRHLMDGSLPRSLKHIISNAEYYGASLFLLATDVVTVYVFQEPSLLSSLQEKGLTDVMLHALLVKDVPATREFLASLPNVFSALCLNNRGLQAFIQCKPFDCLFTVLLSPDYLPAMRRRRSSDPLGDTASNLGNAMDELMRHQPSLRTDATKAIIKLLEEVCAMGRDTAYVCQKPQPKAEHSTSISLRSTVNTDPNSSDDEDDEDDIASTHSSSNVKPTGGARTTQTDGEGTTEGGSSEERIPIPLMDYVLNVMKFVESILSNNTTDDHCREFVNQKGLVPLMSILGLPNLPIDFPTSPSCQAVASVCKCILTLSHEPQVLKQGLLQLNEVLQSLEPLHKVLDPPGGSVLLHELASVPPSQDATLSSQATPLLHGLSSAHAYITMFTHVCKVGQSDIRSISVSHWGSELGLQVLNGLSMLYTSLVWESTVLLAFCSEDILPSGCEFGKADLEKLLPKESSGEGNSKSEQEENTNESRSLTRSADDNGSNGVSAAMESLTTSETALPGSPMETEEASQSAGQQASTSKEGEGKKSTVSTALQAQMKQIKPLLSASSRLGRALAELLGLLVKLCVGSPVRQRRSQITPVPTAPTPSAKAVAAALAGLLSNSLKWTPPPASPVPKLRLTFLICSVGFTSPMLFDEKKYPYYLMLQKFVSSGGQKALFEAFKWALSCNGTVPLEEGLESENLPDGTGEFLDAWLMLVEKMVNTKNVLESPHVLPTKSTQPGFVSFDPIQYLIKTHKRAFEAVLYLWNKKPLQVYGSRMSESILAILCHIIKGEAIIKEKQASEQADTSKSNTPAATTPAAAGPSNAFPSRFPPPEQQVNQDHLQQLMDMGFGREQCIHALSHTSNIEQATEYILTHPMPAAPSTASAAAALLQGSGMDMDLSDEDQMMRAIAMSLGENVLMSTDGEEKPAEVEAPKEVKEEVEDEAIEQLDTEHRDSFTQTMIPGCMQLLDTLPESVYRICDLINVVTVRNGEEWRNNVLTCITTDVKNFAFKLIEVAATIPASDSPSVMEWASCVTTAEETPKLACRLHLLTLLFEEMKTSAAASIEMACSDIMDVLLNLLTSTQKCLAAVKEPTTPKWMTPLLLLIDIYQKISVSSKRKLALRKLIGENHVWKWFDARNGRWCNYSLGNNKTIDDAYQSGEMSIRFTAGRRRYTVQFNTMVQINEETGNRRPIMLSLPVKQEEKPKEIKDNSENSDSVSVESEPKSNAEGSNMEMEDHTSPETEGKKEAESVVKGLSPDQTFVIIRCSVSLIGLPVDPDALHAVMRLILRLTKDHVYALEFAQCGGTRLLLSLTQASAFQGFTTLVTLIFRHILEEPDTLKHSFEKVMRSACQGAGSSLSGVTQGTLGTKELHYVLRVLTPLVCRHPDIFLEVSQALLRISLPPPAKTDEDEARLVSPNTPQILKCLPTKQSSIPPVIPELKNVITGLMNSLILKYYGGQEPTATQLVDSDMQGGTLSDLANVVAQELASAQSAAEAQNKLAKAGEEGQSSEEGSGNQTEEMDAEEKKKKSPLLTKSGILRLLAELVKSYASCASIVTHHTYEAGQSELVSESCSVLAFILDNLLPQCQTAGDKDCPALARMVIASIAACNHSPEAQSALVVEIKGSLQRSLVLTESQEKHSRVQALTGIISTVMESCPSPGHIANQVFKGQQTNMNNMVKIILKRGLVNDLARIAHSLDLSSPNMAATVNSALKPLEILSRIVNQPQTVTSSKLSKPKATSTESTQASVVDEVVANNPPAEEQANATTETRNASVTVEDVTDTEHDDTVETSHALVMEPPLETDSQREELDGVLDQLLQRGTDNDSEDQVLGEIIMERRQTGSSRMEESQDDVLIDVEVEPEEADDHNSQFSDHQMASQMSGDDAEDDDDQQGDDGIQESDCDESGDDDDEDEDNNDDQHPDEEEDDTEDEDEGSDMEADNDDVHDMDDTLYRVNDDDLYVELDDMLASGPHMLFGNRSHIRTYQLPVAVHDNDNANDFAGPILPPAPSGIPTTHPLLIRHADTHGFGGSLASRVHRAGRQRGTYRYNPSTQTLHVHYNTAAGRHPHPPAILQRLLGPGAAADVLQLTNSLTAGNGGQARFHLVTNDDLRLVPRNDEDIFEDIFQDQLSDYSQAGSGVLSSVPSALGRWSEESHVLDVDSMHDCVTLLKPEIIEELEKHRDKELAERKARRHKEMEQKALKDAEKNKEKGDKSNEESKGDTESKGEGSETGSLASTGDLPSSVLPSGSGSNSVSNASTLESAIMEMLPGMVANSSRNLANAVNLDPLFSAATLDSPLQPLPSLSQAASSGHAATALSFPSVTDFTPSMRPHFTSDQSSSSMVESPPPIPPPPETAEVTRSALSEMEATESQPDRPSATEESSNLSESDQGAGETDNNNAGMITPEETSNITSSDAVTINSSGTSTGQSSDPPSTADSGTPSEPAAAPQSSSGTAVPMDVPGSSNESGGGQPSSGLPEGVDPSFLAALPDNIRQEVIAEQLRLHRIQQCAQQQQQEAEALGVTEVSAEFLAALPPNIQEEVLAQQRAEQARLAAQQNTSQQATAVDPEGFIASLPSTLRQQVLADMDDSMVAVLPPNLASEAQSLRREMEDRHRRLMQERLLSQGAASISAVLQQSGLAGRLGAGRYSLGPPRTGGAPWGWGTPRLSNLRPSRHANTVQLRGRYLLDHEALACLLILLFLDEPKLNTSRLHRVFRNLCYHTPTRGWLIQALLAILERTKDGHAEEEKCLREASGKGKSSDGSASESPWNTCNVHGQTGANLLMSITDGTPPSWLSVSMDAALGSRTNVFQIHRGTGKKHSAPANTSLGIHPQASPMICRHVLDTLISLAKSFPCQFLPANPTDAAKCEATSSSKDGAADNVTKPKGKDGSQTPKGTSKPAKAGSSKDSKDSKPETDLWDLLIRLDSTSSSKKQKGIQKVHSGSSTGDITYSGFECAPLGQLMTMLAHPVIRRSQLLTDKLLRLLGLVSMGLPDSPQGNVPAVLSAAASAPRPVETAVTAVASSKAEETTPSTSEKNETKNEGAILEVQLQLAVEVLTSKSCSEEGLEDATNLLLQISHANNPTRETVLKLLLNGANHVGLAVCEHIKELLHEVRFHNEQARESNDDESMDDTGASTHKKGVISDRFSKGGVVVVHASARIKNTGRELQLPSMSLLTSKTSSQHFFLRILKVIIQLREAARQAANKSKLPEPSELSSITEAIGILAEAESIMQGIEQRTQQNLQQSQLLLSQAASALAAGSAGSSGQPAVPAIPAVPALGEGSSNSNVPDVLPRSNSSEPNEDNSETNPTSASGGEASNSVSQSTTSDRDTPMEVDQATESTSQSGEEKEETLLPRLSEQLQLEELWETLGLCLLELANTSDHHAVLVLQPAVEAFFLLHAGEKEKQGREPKLLKREDQLDHLNVDLTAPMSPAAPSSDHPPGSLTRENSVMSVSGISANLPPDTQKFLKFAETHRTVLNQILRQATTPLADGPFSVLVNHTRVLDFDVKRRYFRQELDRMDEGLRREDLAVHVRRENVFEDSFRELHRRSADEWKHRFYIVFEGEEGQDAGGLLREWYVIISREIFNPMYALFATSPGDRVTYTINPLSHCNSNHLSYFKFVGRIIAKAIYDNKLLECYFTRAFYKHILGVALKYTDIESEDYSFYQGIRFLLDHDVKDLGYDLTFSTEVQEFGVTQSRDLKPNGHNIPVTEENKMEYVKLVCQMKMMGSIRQQLNSYLEGFYDIIPKRLISIFNEQELELLISGLPTIDIDDLKANSEYHKYQPNSLQIVWFWRALRSFDQAERACFLQFVTGTSKVPLQGFAHLEGMNGTQKFQVHRDDRSTDRLPCAHTCFNQLDLPAYETYDKLRRMLLLAVNECSEGFGLA